MTPSPPHGLSMMMTPLNRITTLIVLVLCAVPTYCLQCRFTLGSYTYDICPLFFESSATGKLLQVYQDDPKETPSMITRKAYDIDLAGDGLPYIYSLPSSQQCPQGTWICMKVFDIKPDYPSDIPEVLQILPLAGNLQYEDFSGHVDAEAQLVPSDMGFGIPSLEITLGGGYYQSQPQRAQFLFLCDETAQEPSLPVVKESRPSTISQNNSDDDVQTHVFTWTSRHACPVERGESTSPLSSWWSSLFADEAPQEESTELRPSKGKTAGIIIGSIAGTCVLLGGVYYLHSRRNSSSKAYDTPSPSELFKQWSSVPVYYLQQIPLSSISFSSVRSFIVRPFTRSGRSGRSSRSYRYSPLFAEEYEIQDRELVDGDDEVVDLQAQKTSSSRVNASRSNIGYGSI